MNSEIENISREMVTLWRREKLATDVWNTAFSELHALGKKLVGMSSSVEIKQQFLLRAIILADLGVETADLKNQVWITGDKFLELVKVDRRVVYTTVDGVEIKIEPTITFKMPEVFTPE